MIKFGAFLEGFTMRPFSRDLHPNQLNFCCKVWHASMKMRGKWSLIFIGFNFLQSKKSSQTFYTLNKVDLANFYNLCFVYWKNPSILRLVFIF